MSLFIPMGRSLIPFFARQRIRCVRGFFPSFPMQFTTTINIRTPHHFGTHLLPVLLLSPQDAKVQTYRFVLEDKHGNCSWSAWIGQDTKLVTPQSTSKIQSKLDYFVIPRGMRELKLGVEFLQEKPKSYELILTLKDKNPVFKVAQNSQEIVSPKSILCQYKLPKIGHRICSPTTVAMMMGLKQNSLSKIAQEIFHKSHQIYGIWPQAIHMMQKNGYTALHTYLRSDKELVNCLNLYGFVGASIQVKAGELQGFPLEQGTSGHLVLICGMDGEFVWVADPANPKKELIAYPKAQFLRCLARSGGLVYLSVGKKRNK